jgi:anti-sigma-K factor RskA
MDDYSGGEANRAQQSDRQICAEVAALIPAYALGAADPAERALVEANLARCPQAQQLLDEYRDLTDALLFSAPPVEAPPALGTRVQHAIDPAQQDRPISFPQQARPNAHWFARLFSGSGMRRRLGSPALTALLLLLLLGFGGYWTQQLGAMRQQQALLVEQLAQQAEMLVVLGAGNTHRVELPPAVATEAAMLAAVVFDPERPEAFLYVDHFPPLSRGTLYQVWLIQADRRVSGGLFPVDEEGSGMLFLEAPEPIGAYNAMEITPEPAAGSSAPTAPPVVHGPL